MNTLISGFISGHLDIFKQQAPFGWAYQRKYCSIICLKVVCTHLTNSINSEYSMYASTWVQHQLIPAVFLLYSVLWLQHDPFNDCVNTTHWKKEKHPNHPWLIVRVLTTANRVSYNWRLYMFSNSDIWKIHISTAKTILRFWNLL